MSQLNNAAKEIHEDSTEKGFWMDRVRVPIKMKESGRFTEREIDFVKNAIKSQTLILAISEICEAQEAMRYGRTANVPAFDAAAKHSNDLSKTAFEMFIKDTPESEISDAIMRLLDYAEANGIDIDKHIELKRSYNQKRPFKHGKDF